MDTPARRSAVPQPEPNLTPDELVERARALRPMLRAQQEQADAQGYYTDEVHEAMKKAGLYRIVQPKMFGGYEFDVPTLLRCSLEISRGQPGAGWCYTLATSHALVVASYFSPAVQAEIFGPEGDFRTPHKAPPSGTFERVDGGYRVSGVWTYASGVPVSTHFMGGATLPPQDGKPPSWSHFIVPRSEITILDDWGGDKSFGMKASGSQGVKLENVFVPDSHFIHSDLLLSSSADGSGTPGTELHGNPMYLGVVGGVFHATFGAILTGTARAMFDEYEEKVLKRDVPNQPGAGRAQDPDTLRVVGKAMQMIDASEAITLACGQMYMDQCKRWQKTGEQITAEDTLRMWGMAQEACYMSCEAMDMMFKSAGARSTAPGQKIGRYFQDIQMYLVHPSSQPRVSTMLAQAYLGQGGALFAERGRNPGNGPKK